MLLVSSIAYKQSKKKMERVNLWPSLQAMSCLQSSPYELVALILRVTNRCLVCKVGGILNLLSHENYHTKSLPTFSISFISPFHNKTGSKLKLNSCWVDLVVAKTISSLVVGRDLCHHKQILKQVLDSKLVLKIVNWLIILLNIKPKIPISW